MKVAVILPCAGTGERFGAAGNKLFVRVAGRYLLQYTLDAVNDALAEISKTCPCTAEIVLVHASNDRDKLGELVSRLPLTFAPGGKTRAQSVKSGLLACDAEIVLVHDGARPFAGARLFADCLESVRAHGSGIPALPVTDTVKQVAGGQVRTLDRSTLCTVQTPQGFYREDLLAAYAANAQPAGAPERTADGSNHAPDSITDRTDREPIPITEGTDDAQVYERSGRVPHLFPGDARNHKITYPEDLAFFADLARIESLVHPSTERGCEPPPEPRERELSSPDLPQPAEGAVCARLAPALSSSPLLQTPGVRVGFGHDVHRLVPGRRLVLGGEEIPFSLGLAGHSDADVLVHALMDAMLSAAGLRDIGCYFPDTDPRYAGISSLTLLGEVTDLLRGAGYAVGNASVSVVCEQPKLRDYIPAMKERIAAVLGISTADLGISAGTNEGLGALGEGQGICALAACLIRPL